MNAIVQDRYGVDPASVLRLEEIDRPAIGDDEVLVRVVAAGVERGVWHLMAGRPYPVRAAFGLRAPKTRVRGWEFAGRVEAVGASVSGIAPAEEVYGRCEGSFAEYAAAEPGRLARKPANLSFTQAAAVPVSGITALKALRDHAKVEAGQRVLVIGASGGVGTFAVQLAKAFGLEVTGVCSTAKVDLVRSLGADHVVDYTRADFTRAERPFDAIVDTGGNTPLSRLRRALAPSGTLVIVGGEGGGPWLGGMQRPIAAQLISLASRQKLGTFVSSETREDLDVLRELIEAGKVTPAVDRTFPLSEAPAAVQYLVDGRARGKVVVTI